MKFLSLLLPLFLWVFTLTATSTAVEAQQSTQLQAVVPATARVNTTTTVGAVLRNAWTGATMWGYPVVIGIGPQYSLSQTTYYSNSAGLAQRTWRFTQPGRYRVTFFFPGGWGFMDSRTTVFITVS